MSKKFSNSELELLVELLNADIDNLENLLKYPQERAFSENWAYCKELDTALSARTKANIVLNRKIF